MSSMYRNFTLKSLFRRRKEWYYRIFICSFTVATLLIFSVIYSSIQYDEYKDRLDIYGSFDFSVYETSGSTSNFLRDNALVDEIGTMAIYGTVSSSFSEYTGYLGTVDESAFNLMGLELEKGYYPQKNTEIALEKDLLLHLGIDEVIGQKISLQFQDGLKHVETITFTLCGILNSYHNSYLKQGPLVTAFVCNNFSSTKRYPVFNNNFVLLKQGYRSNAIMKELQQAVQLSINNTNEKWYYNTYKTLDIKYGQLILFLILMYSVIFTSIIYQNYFFYYINRYKELKRVHIIGLNKQKIYKILSQEAATSILISILFGVGATLLFCCIIIVVHLIYPQFYSLYIDLHNLGISCIIATLTLILSVLISRLHSSFTNQKKPVLKLPVPVSRNYSDKNKYPHFIGKRFCKVYRIDLIYYTTLQVIAFSSIFIFVLLSTYYTDEISNITEQYAFDYAIGQSPFSNNTDETIEEIPDSLMVNLKKINEIDVIFSVRYFYQDSTPIIEITEESNFSYLLWQSENEDFNTDNTLQCIVYLPPDKSSYTDSIVSDSIKVGDTITLTYASVPLDVTVTSVITEAPDTPMPYADASKKPYIFLSSQLYSALTDANKINDYNYIGIQYCSTADKNVITNIIDNLCYLESSQYTRRTILDAQYSLESIRSKVITLSWLCSFFVLISCTIKKNTYIEELKFLLPQLQLLWALGLDKKRMIRSMQTMYILILVKSMILACVVSFIFTCSYLLLNNTGSSILNIIINIYTSPNVYIYSFLIIALLVTLQLFGTFRSVKKIINKF